MAFFELRQYRIQPGQMQRWVKFFDEVIVPYQVSRGMIVVGSWQGQGEDDDLFVWIRRFESEEDYERIRKNTYETDEWRNDMSPSVGEMMIRDKIVVARLEATPLSILR